jgi:polar amino acid transport system permease protein
MHRPPTISLWRQTAAQLQASISPIQNIQLKAWHGLVLLLVFVVSTAFAQVDTARSPVQPSAIHTLQIWMPFILTGFILNLVMSFLGMALATVIGAVLGLMEISPSRLIRIGASLYTQLFRNTPWIVILFAVMLLVPFRIRLSNGTDFLIPDWIKATFALSLPVAANVAEIVRGAVLSIPGGQWDSAESLAFPRWRILWIIILPQCIKRIIPPWMNWYAILTLSTPIVAILGVHEAVGNAQQAMEAAGAKTSFLLPFYSFILVLFFIYIYPISRFTLWLERNYFARN